MPIKTITRRTIFSQGSSTVSAKVASNHILQRQKKNATLDFGGRAKEKSGFGGGSPCFTFMSWVVSFGRALQPWFLSTLRNKSDALDETVTGKNAAAVPSSLSRCPILGRPVLFLEFDLLIFAESPRRVSSFSFNLDAAVASPPWIPMFPMHALPPVEDETFPQDTLPPVFPGFFIPRLADKPQNPILDTLKREHDDDAAIRTQNLPPEVVIMAADFSALRLVPEHLSDDDSLWAKALIQVAGTTVRVLDASMKVPSWSSY